MKKNKQTKQQAASRNTSLLGDTWRQQATSRSECVRACHRREAPEKTRGKRAKTLNGQMRVLIGQKDRVKALRVSYTHFKDERTDN